MLARTIAVLLGSLIIISSSQANTPSYQVLLENIDGRLKGSVAFEISETDWKQFLAHITRSGEVRGTWDEDTEDSPTSWTLVERGRFYAKPVALDSCKAQSRSLVSSSIMKRKAQAAGSDPSTHIIEVHYSCQ